MTFFKRSSFGVAAIAAVLVFTTGATAAQAVDNDNSSAALDALHSLGLLDSGATASRSASPDPGPTGVLDAATGLTVQGAPDTGAVNIAPVNAGEAKLVDGAALYSASESHTYALTGEGSAANAGYIVIHDESAPSTFQFAVEIDGSPADLELVDGAVLVKDAAGNVANMIAPGWATDALGQELRTSYTVADGVVTQEVWHQGATYPVVADPRLECDALFCTAIATRSETASVANHGSTASIILGGLCTALGTVVAGVVCAAGAQWAVGVAADAKDQGKCLGVRKFHYVSAAVFPVVATC